MAVIRVDNDGKKVISKHARRTAAAATIMAVIGVVVYATGDPLGGLFFILGGNTMATIHNLADDSQNTMWESIVTTWYSVNWGLIVAIWLVSGLAATFGLYGGTWFGKRKAVKQIAKEKAEKCNKEKKCAKKKCETPSGCV